MPIVIRRSSETLFTAWSGDVQVGRARVAIRDGVWEAYSTVVEPAYGGHGIGSSLAHALLDTAREAGAMVIPSCWFIDGFIDRHEAEYGGLRAAQRPEPVGSVEDPACRIAPAVLSD